MFQAIKDKAISFAAKQALTKKLDGIICIADVVVNTRDNAVQIIGDIDDPVGIINIDVILTGCTFSTTEFSFSGVSCSSDRRWLQKALMLAANTKIKLGGP